MGADIGKGFDAIFRRLPSGDHVGLVDEHAQARHSLLAPVVQATLVAALKLGGDLGDDRGGLALEPRHRLVEAPTDLGGRPATGGHGKVLVEKS